MNNRYIMLGAMALVMIATPAMAGPEGGKFGGRAGQMMDQMFTKHDADGDGVVTKDEFMKGAEERFNTMDESGDGQVTKEEMQAGAQKMREKWKTEHGGEAPPPPPSDAPPAE